MFGAAVALAFTAGMVATFNPCGFSLLPAYVSAFVAVDSPSERTERRIIRAISGAAVMAMSFVAVFAPVGLLVGTVADPLRRRLPWITIIAGTLLVVAGVAMAIGWKPSVALRMVALRSPGGRFATMAVYGATFALASLSCTIGPFLAVTAAILDRSLWEIVAAYVAYALGMGAMILAISLLVALARTKLVDRLRGLTRKASRVGGALMVVAGLYVIWYARWELAVLSGNLEMGGLVEIGESVRGSVIATITAIGPVRIAVATAIAVVVGLTAARQHVRVRPARRPSDGSGESDGRGTQLTQPGSRRLGPAGRPQVREGQQ